MTVQPNYRTLGQYVGEPLAIREDQSEELRAAYARIEELESVLRIAQTHLDHGDYLDAEGVEAFAMRVDETLADKVTA